MGHYFFPVPLSYLPLSQVKSSLFMVIKIINIHHFLIAVLFPSLATWRTVARLMGLSDSVRQHRNIQCPQAEVWEIELFSGASLGQVTGRRRMEGFQDSTRQSCNWSDIALVLWDDGLETCRGPSHQCFCELFSPLIFSRVGDQLYNLYLMTPKSEIKGANLCQSLDSSFCTCICTLVIPAGKIHAWYSVEVKGKRLLQGSQNWVRR